MKPDLRDPRLLRAWALTFIERAQSEGVSGVVRTHFEAGTITRCETTRRDMPAGIDKPEPSGLAKREQIGDAEAELAEWQHYALHGAVEAHLSNGWITRFKIEISKKPRELGVACRAVG